MPSVNSATSTYLPTTGMTAGDTGPTRAPKTVLDQSDFLKLLTVQLSKQDPMKPMDDQSFIAQMAQFSSLEQMNTLTSEFTVMRADQQMTTASSLIGRQVTVDDGENLTTGVVDAVDAPAEGGVNVVINGQVYDLSMVRYVSAPTASTSTDTP